MLTQCCEFDVMKFSEIIISQIYLIWGYSNEMGRKGLCNKTYSKKYILPTYGKVLNIISNQRNENSNHNKIYSHYIAKILKFKNIKHWQESGATGILINDSGNTNWYSHSLALSRKIKAIHIL